MKNFSYQQTWSLIITWYSTTLIHFNWLINLSWLGIQITSNLLNNYFNNSNHFNDNFYKALSYWTLMSISPSFTLTSRSDLSKQQICSNDTLLCILLRTKQNTPLPSPEQETLTRTLYHLSFLLCHLLTWAFSLPPAKFLGLPEHTSCSHISKLSRMLFPLPRNPL